MERHERALFGDTLQRATQAHTGAELDTALDDLGWHRALAEDTASAVGLLFEHQGRAGATSSALDDVLGFALGTETGDRPSVVLPALDSAEPPGTGDTGRVTVTGLATSRIADAARTLVVCARHDGSMTVMTVATDALTCRRVAGLDPFFELVEVGGDTAPCAAPVILDGRQWTESVRLGRLAVGHELVGASAAMMELAGEHARQRVQFGRPIGSFQAVRHRLADAFVTLESARALLDAAWEDAGDDAASMAKALAGRAARTVARHTQQVLAGIGFTTEHPLHRYVRRVLMLDELLGATRSLTIELGRDVLARRRLPEPIPL